MTSWLHWIGKSYYTLAGFASEAQKFGISRRVSLQNLKKMSWGDWVCCLYDTARDKGGTYFLEFRIEKITGLSAEATRMLQDEFALRPIDFGGTAIIRGCGDYMTGVTFYCDADMSQVVDRLDKAKDEGMDIGKPMIGCEPPAVKTTWLPMPVFSDIPFRQGFRSFDRRKARIDIAMCRKESKSKTPRLEGQYYTDDKWNIQDADIEIKTDKAIQAVHNYKRS